MLSPSKSFLPSSPPIPKFVIKAPSSSSSTSSRFLTSSLSKTTSTRILSSSPLEIYNTYLTSSPLLTKSITAGVILGAADYATQMFSGEGGEGEGKEEKKIDYVRTARFSLFGFILQAPWNHYYYLLLDSTLPPTPDPFTVTTGVKLLIDQFLQAPIFTILIFYFLGLTEGKTITSVNTQLRTTYVQTMKSNWLLWIPATFINLAFVDPEYRVLFLNCVFFFWSIYLSLVVNGEADVVKGEDVV
ncbi:hypothetical protein TrLO_g216 [Triparma laevis f. longispina]|uniref:Uncharacterized protein n=1 Tax=Triparma laevis f. longispina TaxID=1714387 RepID=A0A9W6ZNU0_9STRA|nr:hypothetical protein TrLO_g216 [Triparma laevis f. longispina]